MRHFFPLVFTFCFFFSAVAENLFTRNTDKDYKINEAVLFFNPKATLYSPQDLDKFDFGIFDLFKVDHLLDRYGSDKIDFTFFKSTQHPPRTEDDRDGDGIIDTVDQCIDDDLPQNNYSVVQDPDSSRHGCMFVPLARNGSDELKLGEGLSGFDLLISEDRSTFLSVRGGVFRVYAAKYWPQVLDSSADNEAIQTIPYLVDLFEELDVDSFEYPYSKQVELVYSFAPNPDPNQKSNGSLGFCKKDSPIYECFAILYDGQLTEDNTLYLTSIGDAHIYLTSNIEGFTFNDIKDYRNNIRMGVAYQYPANELNSASNSTAVNGLDDPFSDYNVNHPSDPNTVPRNVALLSENKLYRFATPAFYAYYNLTKAIDTSKGISIGKLSAGLLGFAVITAITSLAPEAEALVLAAEEVESVVASLEGLEGAEGTFTEAAAAAQQAANNAEQFAEDAEDALNAAVRDDADDEEIVRLQNEWVQARISRAAAREAAEEAAVNSESHQNLLSELSDNAGQLESASEEATIGNTLLSSCGYPCTISLTNPPKFTTSKILTALSAVTGGITLGIINTLAKVHEKIQARDAILARNLPVYIPFSSEDYVIGENMLLPKAPRLDYFLKDSPSHEDFLSLFKEERKLVLTNPLFVINDKPKWNTENVKQSIEASEEGYVNYYGAPYVSDLTEAIPSGNDIDLFKITRKFQRQFCPSYIGKFENDAFKLVRKVYLNNTESSSAGTECMETSGSPINPITREEEIFSSASKTSGVGKSAKVSNFGNLVVKDDTGCTLWDVFSQELNRDLPDFTEVDLNRILLENHRKKYLVQKELAVPSEYATLFTNELKAGDGLTPEYSDDKPLTDGAFILMENGKSALLTDGTKTVTIDPQYDIEIIDIANSPKTIYDVPTLNILWEDSGQVLGSAMGMGLNAENGDLITYDCSGNTISTISIDHIFEEGINNYKSKYGDIFVGVDYTDSGDGQATDKTDVILYAGSGIGANSKHYGLPIWSYSSANHNYNPFPLFDINEDEGKAIINLSDELMSLDDFYISKDGLAMIRFVAGKGISLYTRTSKDRRNWTFVKTLAQQSQIVNNNHTIINIIRAVGNDANEFIIGDVVELLGDGSFNLISSGLVFTSDVVASNQYIGGLLNETSIPVTHKYLMSENKNCIATPINDKINIFQKNTDGRFILTADPLFSLGLVNDNITSTDSYFYIDERGGIKLIQTEPKEILFESSDELKFNVALSGDGTQFQLKLTNDCALVVNKNTPNDPETFTLYNTYSSSMNTNNFNNYNSSGNISLDKQDDILYVNKNFEAQDLSLFYTQVPYISYNNYDSNIHCRATVYNGVFYLEDRFTGEVLWFLGTEKLPPLGENSLRFATLKGGDLGGFVFLDRVGTGFEEVFDSKNHHIDHLVNKNFSANALKIVEQTNENNEKTCAIHYVKTKYNIELLEWSSTLHHNRKLLEDIEYLNTGETLRTRQRLVSPDRNYQAVLDEANPHKIKVVPYNDDINYIIVE